MGWGFAESGFLDRCKWFCLCPSPIGNMHKSLGHKVIVEDCDVIYNRSIFSTHKGGRVFNLRGLVKTQGVKILFLGIFVLRIHAYTFIVWYFECSALAEASGL